MLTLTTTRKPNDRQHVSIHASAEADERGRGEPPTDRFVECVPEYALRYRFRAWEGCSRPGAYRVVAQ